MMDNESLQPLKKSLLKKYFVSSVTWTWMLKTSIKLFTSSRLFTWLNFLSISTYGSYTNIFESNASQYLANFLPNLPKPKIRIFKLFSCLPIYGS